MKIAIVGSRDFELYDKLVEYIKSKIDVSEITVVVSGGAKGADTLAERFAKENNIPLTVVLPDWKKHGRAAGPLRNKIIVDIADIVFAFWDGKSKGTKSAITHTIKTSKKHWVCKYIPDTNTQTDLFGE